MVPSFTLINNSVQTQSQLVRLLIAPADCQLLLQENLFAQTQFLNQLDQEASSSWSVKYYYHLFFGRGGLKKKLIGKNFLPSVKWILFSLVSLLQTLGSRLFHSTSLMCYIISRSLGKTKIDFQSMHALSESVLITNCLLIMVLRNKCVVFLGKKKIRY